MFLYFDDFILHPGSSDSADIANLYPLYLLFSVFEKVTLPHPLIFSQRILHSTSFSNHPPFPTFISVMNSATSQCQQTVTLISLKALIQTATPSECDLHLTGSIQLKHNLHHGFKGETGEKP